MSKRFQFDFQRLLNLRERIEEQKAHELAEAKNKQQQNEKSLQKLLNTRENLMLSVEAAKRRKAAESIAKFQMMSGYMSQLGDDIKSRHLQTEKSRSETEDKRKALLKAVQSKEVMNNLRDKQRDQFRKLQNQRDLGEESEIALRMFFHKEDGDISSGMSTSKEDSE